MVLPPRTLSFFGRALNNTSEHREVSLFYAIWRFFTLLQDDKFVKT